MIQSCPNCHTGEYKAQSQTINLTDTLKRWEIETSTRFQLQTWAEYEKIGTSTFFKCDQCHFGAFVPAAAGTSNFYNDITIDGEYYVHEKWEFTKTFNLIQKHAIKSLLDYGCGGGAFLKQAAQKFLDCSFDGYDQNPQTVKNFEGTSIGFTNDMKQHGGKTYDVITAFQILEHLEDPFAALRSLRAALNDNGLLIISVPNTEGPIRYFPDALTEIPPHHVNRFGKSSLEVYVKNAGFKVEEVAYEPLARILWESYLPVMAREFLPCTLRKLFVRLKGQSIILHMVRLLQKTNLKSLPLKGHSIYVVARKCAE